MALKPADMELFGQTRKVFHGPPSHAEMGALINGGFNVLFIGEYGTGKTSSVRNYCEAEGIDYAYYNAPTMDPFIDLVGVPSPSKHSEDEFILLKSKQLKDAEVMFIDEPNRADHRVTNALLEVIQFRAISGTPLPKVRSIFAAINPNNGDYHVSELDPAFLDRFDQIIAMPAKYDPKVIAEGLMGNPNVMADEAVVRRVAKAAVVWAKSEVTGYISPRKVEGIARAFLTTSHRELTLATVPPTIIYSPAPLWERLVAARKGEEYPRVKDTLAEDGAAKASTMTGGKKVTKEDMLLLRLQFIEAIDSLNGDSSYSNDGSSHDNSAEYIQKSNIMSFDLDLIAASRKDNGISGTGLPDQEMSQIRKMMSDCGCFDGKNTTFTALSALSPTQGGDHFMALMKAIAPKNSNARGYQWFADRNILAS